MNILTTNRTGLKRKMLTAAIKKHQGVIDDFKVGLKNILGSQSMVNEQEIDLSQMEFNTEMEQKSNTIADQLAFANEEMKLLFNMAPSIDSIHNTVQLGTIVVTDKRVLFVSASIEQFEVEGVEVFGLSTKSPLYKAMAGKKKGDSFSYKNDTYLILDLF